ncbi:TPA: secretin [Vibrio vulnificus]
MNGLFFMGNRHRKMLIALTVCSAITGCANFTPLPKNKSVSLTTSEGVNSFVVVEGEHGDKNSTDSQESNYKVIDKTIATAPLLQISHRNISMASELNLPKDKLNLNADHLPLIHFINLALGDVLGVNYVIDSELSTNKTPITLRVSTPVDSNRLLGLVEEVLQVNDIALVLDDGLIKVIPAEKTQNITPTLMSSALKPTLKYGKVAEIVPVYYLPLFEASNLASQYLREQGGGTVLAQNNLNALMVVAKQKDINKLRELLSVVDVPKRVARNMSIIQPQYISVESLISDLQVSLSAAGVPVYIDKGANGVVLVPLGNGSLLVTASTKAWLNYTIEWSNKLDKPKAVKGSKGIYAYYMANTRAEDAWQVVSAIFGDESSSASDETDKVDLLAAARAKSKQENAVSTQVTPGNVGYQPSSSSKKTDNMQVVTDSYRVVIDSKRNGVLFTGEYQDYQRLVELLQFVDQRPRQVLLQATIAEVNVTDGYSLGFAFEVTDGKVTGGTANASGGTSILEAGNLNLVGVFSDITAQFSAALDNGKAQILSSPKLLALDQESARITIGDQIQVRSGEVSNGSGDDAKATVTYQYIDVGIALDITPSINKNGLVELTISQEVSSQGASTGDSPTINRRSLQTRLLANSGDTVYMGGLIRQDQNKKEKKVPFLGDLPVLGNLFKSEKTTQNSVELILLVTPYVIHNRDEAQFYTNEFRSLTGWSLSNDI